MTDYVCNHCGAVFWLDDDSDIRECTECGSLDYRMYRMWKFELSEVF
jgi:DNA-directed RNA polymerase subunit RPC12/RpoP